MTLIVLIKCGKREIEFIIQSYTKYTCEMMLFVEKKKQFPPHNIFGPYLVAKLIFEKKG